MWSSTPLSACDIWNIDPTSCDKVTWRAKKGKKVGWAGCQQGLVNSFLLASLPHLSPIPLRPHLPLEREAFLAAFTASDPFAEINATSARIPPAANINPASLCVTSDSSMQAQSNEVRTKEEEATKSLQTQLVHKISALAKTAGLHVCGGAQGC